MVLEARSIYVDQINGENPVVILPLSGPSPVPKIAAAQTHHSGTQQDEARGLRDDGKGTVPGDHDQWVRPTVIEIQVEVGRSRQDLAIRKRNRARDTVKRQAVLCEECQAERRERE
jgi:hypothetical protein